MRPRALMVQGTASDAGKSVVAAAICRILSDRGVRVAPFKAQNMALNSYVTHEGLEMGRAQAVQAEAARIRPRVEMNPVLLKPTTDTGSQVILLGRPVGTFPAGEYYARQDRAWEAVRSAYAELAREYEVLVIEGAGSPAEINLADRDLANMRTADLADAAVILVADIERGGVFASLVGTLELLPPRDRARVQGLIVNKFRGDISLLAPGLRDLQGRTGVPVLGVLPYIRDLAVEEEDGVALTRKARLPRSGPGSVAVGVIRLPRLSNYTDLDPLEGEPGVEVVYVEDPDVVQGLAAVVLPGSKDVLGDLEYLEWSGLGRAVRAFAARGGTVVGICGGFQMLGREVADPHAVESRRGAAAGLGLLPVRTVLCRDKVTARVEGLSAEGGIPVRGYEIHMGRTHGTAGCAPCFRITRENGRPAARDDGARRGNVWGTYLHGLFENDAWRRRFLAGLGWRGAPARDYATRKEREYDRLARIFAEHVDVEAILRLVGAG